MPNAKYELGFSQGAQSASLSARDEALEDEIERLKSALRFYANKHHFMLSDEDAWDTVSGEPQNFWCDEAGTATVEDGSVAAMTLRGEEIQWKDGDEDATPQPIPGERALRSPELNAAPQEERK